jgi:hypothetical protein
MIQVNKHPTGRLSNIGFGFMQLGDGIIRILSLGFLHSQFTLEYARRQAKRRIMK